MPPPSDNFNFSETLNQASLKIILNQNQLSVKSTFDPFKKSNFSLLLIFGIAMTGVILTVLFAEELVALIVGLTICGGILVFSLLTILKQLTDFISIDHERLFFRNSLRSHQFDLHPQMKIKIRAKNDYVKLAQPGSGTNYRVFDLYLTHQEIEYRVLNFQMEAKNTQEANKLASEIARLIKEKIRDFSSTS